LVNAASHLASSAPASFARAPCRAHNERTGRPSTHSQPNIHVENTFRGGEIIGRIRLSYRTGRIVERSYHGVDSEDVAP